MSSEPGADAAGSGTCRPAQRAGSGSTWRGITSQQTFTSVKIGLLPSANHARRPRQVLLKALVERYIAEGQPVGSRTLSRASGLELSPATIRNVMSDLEELGLIASPHTSAGRIPTARGYRLFVDTMLTAQREQLPDGARERLRPCRRPAAEGDRQRGAPAVQPVAVRRRGHRAAGRACSATSNSCGCRSGASW